MPAIFLTQTERIRYEQLPGLEPEDIRQGFYLTQADVQFVSIFHGSLNRVAVAIQLCLIRYLGFLPDNWKSHLPQEALSFIFSQLKLEGLPSSFLAEYGNRQPTKSFHHGQVLKFLHFKKWQPLDEPLLELWLIGQGMEHDNERWLLEKFCWKLHQDKILRPAIGTLERIIGGISERLHEETYKRLSFLWSDQLFEVLDTLLLPDAALKLTQHRWLCMPPTTGTYREINRALQKIIFLKELGVPHWDLSVIPANRKKRLVLC